MLFTPCGSTAQFWVLAARPLLTAPGDCDDGEVGGMNGFGRGHQSTRRKPAPTPLYPPQIPLARPGREPLPPRFEDIN
jgi:hypothetical protein